MNDTRNEAESGVSPTEQVDNNYRDSKQGGNPECAIEAGGEDVLLELRNNVVVHPACSTSVVEKVMVGGGSSPSSSPVGTSAKWHACVHDATSPGGQWRTNGRPCGLPTHTGPQRLRSGFCAFVWCVWLRVIASPKSVTDRVYFCVIELGGRWLN